MHSPLDDRLRAEIDHFALRYTCECCVHFDPEPARCSHGYPVEAHRRRDLRVVSELTFCKDFELR